MKWLALLLFLLVACAPTHNREWLHDAVKARTSFELGSGQADAGIATGVDVTDGLTADEAVAVALWQSPSLQAELTQLEAAMASLNEAQRPANPRINNFLLPLDLRQLALVLFIPLESLWQMPARIEAASYELEATAASLVQVVLDAERAVRSAHADVVLFEKRVEVLTRAGAAWSQAVELAEARAASGDIAPVEADQVRAEAILAADLVQRGSHDLTMARTRLLTFLGAPWAQLPPIVTETRPALAVPELAALQALALSGRPELAAAALSVNASAARARWERSRVFNVFLSLDAQAPVGSLVPRVSAGLQAELPLFSQNQGGIGRADAAVARAGHRYLATRLSVLQDVVLARAALERALSSKSAAHRFAVLVEQAGAAATRAYENGSEGYLAVVDALRRGTDAQLREAEVEAEARRAEAELYRAIGGRNALESP